jgi:serine/threonine-protein kinase RsbW
MYRVTVSADADSVTELAPLVATIAARGELSAAAQYALRLAVEEILVNIATHGDGEASEVVVDGDVEADQVWIRLTDSGPAFDPRSAAPPEDLDRPLAERQIGGLGLYLTRRMVDDLGYERRDGHNCTTLIMRRR